MKKRYDAEIRKVLALAAGEAIAVGHDWIGTEHLLLGLLRSVEEASAGSAELRRVLERTNLTLARERVLEYIPPGPEGGAEAGVCSTPRVERVLGYSVGLAAGGGARSVGADHLLLGLLWEVDGVGAKVLAEFGLSYGAAAEALSISVSGLLEPPDDASFGPEVDVSAEELEILLRELPGVVPPGCPVSFNLRENGRAWIALGEEVDAESYVREVLARS